jgi:hypothetical protein
MTSSFAELRAGTLATVGALVLGSVAHAQTIAQRIARADRPVQVVYPSRPSACGDGRGNIGRILDDGSMLGESGWRNCVHGPVRVVVTVMDGEVTRLRTYVGPIPRSDDETITATAPDAAAWLSSLVTKDNSRVASSAILPLVLADAPDPWPLLLRVARDDSRSMNTRREALMWLGNGALEHLGIDRARDDTPDDEMRSQAVFVLSQRPKSESVPALIDLARSAKYPSAKRSAIFWLGQTGDPRAADVFADLLGLR